MIETFKILFGKKDIDKDDFFQTKQRNNNRHKLKIIRSFGDLIFKI